MKRIQWENLLWHWSISLLHDYYYYKYTLFVILYMMSSIWTVQSSRVLIVSPWIGFGWICYISIINMTNINNYLYHLEKQRGSIILDFHNVSVHIYGSDNIDKVCYAILLPWYKFETNKKQWNHLFIFPQAKISIT